ncbi:MAG: ABC transporter ATP-binding protein [Gammaproteobacteria bacterium]|nr:ABC transporter ATP-binding protein [Gammaproteobacteria bacterium]NIR83431.1 ABC transporter ATP-binding protein [Gammaproteobacteria bacterium]NIR91353.1 ABC transporter ATP-binding protein [Gammaproteobacteria bacterium]NIU04593.1 ABC transporter ATP-binding protein [Gammaproteobacteria bacterium]NIV51635.1 ATP-binding cassette domain-containing protein [Gammaproteobacteria bacterium]
MTPPIIAVTDLHFAYGETAVLAGLEFSVAAGEIFGVVGADGAGKTTLLRIAVGQLSPTRGAARVLGRPASAPELRDELAYMPQGFGLYPDLSVAENLQLFADLHGLAPASARRAASSLLARTGLEGFEARRAGQLSGGMMQKLALACALVSGPRVMFLDEPTTGVDPLSRRAFWQLLEGVRAEGVAILYATANMDEAERCDRVGVLEDGRFARQGTPLALAEVSEAALLDVAGSDARRRRGALRELPGVELVFPVGARLHVWLETGVCVREFQSILGERFPELSAEAIPPSLQDTTLRALHRARRSPA